MNGEDVQKLSKESYGYGFDAAKTSLIKAGKADDDATYQAARDAGRSKQPR
ncbi:hypothetical protein ACFFPI_09825 [Arthrobacter methylotrophus]|uniref:Antitoxin n=1 Tax=Arthrobacter methylotrophus TaxID=121291 RepID=A0ABV5UPG7_9MICC